MKRLELLRGRLYQKAKEEPEIYNTSVLPEVKRTGSPYSGKPIVRLDVEGAGEIQFLTLLEI